jgi:high-affinity Fe2+/Pb2+ permease
MPFIKDPRGMSATGLVLGIAAFWVMQSADPLDRVGKVEAGVAVASLILGVVALAFAETAAAEALLAVFMVTIALVWIMKLIDHAGVLHWHEPSGVAR